ncbi:hypothetical protein L596_021746 [Steinernema carpocapsae]|uniref:Uncharacterized protein n=1 Tax=Steinernema carpocapsae TaxID=34508 RepID=A0A4U5MJM9_STECR|nr:hypothetical protein L596_021746 [Steinernema carpocapsae]
MGFQAPVIPGHAGSAPGSSLSPQQGSLCGRDSPQRINALFGTHLRHIRGAYAQTRPERRTFCAVFGNF